MPEEATLSFALDRIFREARTLRRWQERPVEDEDLVRIWELARLGPTSANCQPLRIVFLRGPEAKERLKPLLSPGNVRQTMTAPVTALFAFDPAFHELLPRLWPHEDAKAWFEGPGSQPGRLRAGLLNASLQAGYFLLAARTLGLDCGPMGGFDTAGVEREFLAAASWHALFLCNLGYGDREGLRPRDPRLGFGEACRIL